jgi:putative DNA-invertase from lambdoid prophage Rac
MEPLPDARSTAPRGADVLVVRWVDRLRRNYADVTEVIHRFMTCGVVITTVINGLTFDGATNDPMRKPVRDALIAFSTCCSTMQASSGRSRSSR